MRMCNKFAHMRISLPLEYSNKIRKKLLSINRYNNINNYNNKNEL